MPDYRHPYTNLPKQAFWKTAVADVDPSQIDLAWTPKTPITRTTRIITVGSCFAQHISKALKENGFNWVDAEPAPIALPPEEHAKHGYGVFSFRTGNIYTAALLKQWLLWASGKEAQSTECFIDEGRFFDPFRPSLTVEGFASAEEMLTARQVSLTAIFEAIKQADLFVFTLGLTEAWINKDGYVYPMCPGTLRGTFVDENHKYHNFNEQEVVQDLNTTFDALRVINPGLRFLLTVSPVPLTATASGQHVLSATTYSKSVLRSAAGLISEIREDTDYFPSFELITAPAFKGQFFEPNMRSVSARGVAFVMGQFLTGIDPLNTPVKSFPMKLAVAASGDVKSEVESGICDDIILETWSNRPFDETEDPPNILLIGDSQMGMIAKALDEQGIRYAGGAIMHGSEWHALKFTLLEDAPYFVPTIADARARWQEACKQCFLSKTQHPSKVALILTNIGFHSSQIFSDFGLRSYLQRKYGVTLAGQAFNISVLDVREYLISARIHHMTLLSRFRKAGYKVIWIGDPPVDTRNHALHGVAEEILSENVRALDCLTFQASWWIAETFITTPPNFLSSEIDPATGVCDLIHGSKEYYRQLITEIFIRFPIHSQSSSDP